MKALLTVVAIVGVSAIYAWNCKDVKEVRRQTAELKKRNDHDIAELAKVGIHIKNS